MSASALLEFEHERPSIAEIKTEIQHMLDAASDEECRKVYRFLRDLLR
jgi:hypothetical protein